MISTKELTYVDSWAKKIPMPGMEYSMKVLDAIENCYKLYNEMYKDKEYNFIFSNLEELDLVILPKNLCHMVGIDYNNLSNEYFTKYRSEVLGIKSDDITSYELLEEILANKEKIAELDNNPDNPMKAINYYKSAVKCAIFEKFSTFEKFNFAAINYVGKKETYDYEKSKFLFMPSGEALSPYFLMGIVEVADEPGKYIVNTLLAPKNPERFFDGQEVIIPTQILISSNIDLAKIVATPEEKIKLLTMYENIINKYNLANHVNIYGEYVSTLNELANNQMQRKRTIN